MASLINGLGGEAGFGEGSVSRNDDGYSSAIDITSIFPDGINLFQNVYTRMYVNTNGNITFNYGLSSYTPGVIGANTTNPIFAPFWADVDTRSGVVSASTDTSNTVNYSLSAYRTYLNNDTAYYNTLTVTSALSNYAISYYTLSSYSAFLESAASVTGQSLETLSATDLNSYYAFLVDAQTQIDTLEGDSNYNTSGNSKGTNLVWYDLNEETKTITVTWDDVGYYSYKQDKTNAFQLQIVNTQDGSFDIYFRYEDVNWTTGSASGGTNGLGGTIARAGYSAGDGSHYFELPFSGDQNGMLTLENYTVSGMAEPGVWKLSIADGTVQGIGLEGSNDELQGTLFDDYLDGRSGDDVLLGGDGNDTLAGGEGNDTLNGGIGNDIFFSGVGTDIIQGGEGRDTATYVNRFNLYDFDALADHFSVASDDETSADALYDVEMLTFGDVTLSVDDVLELVDLQHAVSRLYSAVLGRTPDNDGLIYWLNDSTNGTTLQNISAGFEGSEEFAARFGAQSATEFINQLYNNILDRDADQAGYEYWLDEIAQTGDRTGMIVSFSDSEEFILDQTPLIDTYLNNVDLSSLNWL